MDVVCLGILVADIFSASIESLPAAGELRVADRFLLSAGGCAVNTAECLRRLNRKARVLGKVGQDMFGHFILQDLDRLGIDITAVRRSQTHPTSSTFILNVRGEDRRYIHCIGANADFSLADVDFSALDGARVLYVGGYMAMPRFGSDDLAELFQVAKKRSLLTALDVVVPDNTLASLEPVASVLPYTDVFLPNEDEARALTGHRDPLRQAEVLADLNPECIIVITQGPLGALARKGRRVIRAGAFEVDSVDGSGAGDAFAAGLITGLLENWSLPQALRFASSVGASCTRALGCTAAVFHFEEAAHFVAENALDLTEIAE